MAGKIKDKHLQLPWAVVDNEKRALNRRFLVLRRFKLEEEGAAWIDQQDPVKVNRGGFGLDGPRRACP